MRTQQTPTILGGVHARETAVRTRRTAPAHAVQHSQASAKCWQYVGVLLTALLKNSVVY